jgi:hypothetical protein
LKEKKKNFGTKTKKKKKKKKRTGGEKIKKGREIDVISAKHTFSTKEVMLSLDKKMESS